MHSTRNFNIVNDNFSPPPYDGFRYQPRTSDYNFMPPSYNQLRQQPATHLNLQTHFNQNVNQTDAANSTSEDILLNFLTETTISAVFGYIVTAVFTATNPIFGAVYVGGSNVLYGLLLNTTINPSEESYCLGLTASAISYLSMNAAGYTIPLATAAVIEVSSLLALTSCCLPCFAAIGILFATI